MRLLFVHSDHLEFEATTEAGEGVAETEGVPMAGRMEDCVTAFVSVETGDETDPDAAVANAADELRDVTDRLNTRNVVLYPHAHLSDDLADPDAAKTVLRKLKTSLDGDYEVLRAPFGWYKSFEVACKGHPISELSRHVTPERDEDGGGADPSGCAPSDWKLVFRGGETADLPETDAIDSLDDEDADRVGDDMRALVADEVEGETASADEQPSHVELMREQELVGRDESSDAGTLRWYPRGKLIRDSLAEYVDDLAVEFGGMPVETPAMYDLGVRAIREHTEAFGERQYRFESDGRPMLLRFAACVGHFSVMRDMQVSESDLPLRLYELSTSFRRERRDAVAGLKRQRAFTVPDIHTATRDAERAKEELRAQANLALRTGDDLGLNYEPAIRVTREFYEGNAAWVESLADDFGKPALLEILPERHRYWSAKVEFATIDRSGRPVENPTVELDVESAERFGVEYSADDETRHPPVLHCSPTGSIERVLAALLETAAKQETPRLPTWLSPTQVRFVPVGDEHVEHCDALADDLTTARVRADVDERDESVGERIATAETDWVPYYVVVGDREMEDDEVECGKMEDEREGNELDGDAETLKVTVRDEGEEREMTVSELKSAVLDDIGDLPRKRRYLPKHVSKRPRFAER
ncbi:threonine--tRNA ligase [Halorussus gelatinilyticus]|uniref:Threonine--tRNA ligase n=1 Tax=Halorussus gelatinilyticus TaxID=2937524 RepID=A0A8U0II92_9EURY|nr:threonine--tRNA ligase [Halorussus gelatinilyticus]UPW00817.1 threonine--tRNA ligase [Halorussus gelatinilyticus]